MFVLVPLLLGNNILRNQNTLNHSYLEKNFHASKKLRVRSQYIDAELCGRFS